MVRLSIYNMLGQEVRTLVNQFKPQGAYQVIWDGRDMAGKVAPSGLYIYKLQVGNQSQIRRLVLMK